MSYDDEYVPKPKTRTKFLQTKELTKARDEWNDLAIGVIRQAFLDLFDYLEFKDKPNTKEHYDNAVLWFTNEEETEDLKFWCDKAGLTIDGIRNAYRRFETDEYFRQKLISSLGIHKVY